MFFDHLSSESISKKNLLLWKTVFAKSVLSKSQLLKLSDEQFFFFEVPLGKEGRKVDQLPVRQSAIRLWMNEFLPKLLKATCNIEYLVTLLNEYRHKQVIFDRIIRQSET